MCEGICNFERDDLITVVSHFINRNYLIDKVANFHINGLKTSLHKMFCVVYLCTKCQEKGYRLSFFKERCDEKYVDTFCRRKGSVIKTQSPFFTKVTRISQTTVQRHQEKMFTFMFSTTRPTEYALSSSLQYTVTD